MKDQLIFNETKVFSPQINTQIFKLQVKMYTCPIRLKNSLTINISGTNQSMSQFFTGRLILTDYYIQLGVFWCTHLSLNLWRLARDVFGSYEGYSQMKCSSKRSSEKESFFPSLIHKSSSYTSKCSCPIKLQDSQIIKSSKEISQLFRFVAL